MVEGAGRFRLEAGEQRRIRAGELAQAEHGEAVERPLEYGQKRQREHRRKHAADDAPDRGKQECRRLDLVDAGKLKEQDDDNGRHGDRRAGEQKAAARLDAARRKDGERPADKAEHERIIHDVAHRHAEIVGVNVDDEGEQRKDEVQHDRLSAPEQVQKDERDERERARVYADVFAEDEVQRNGDGKDGKHEDDVAGMIQKLPVLKIVIIIDDAAEQKDADDEREHLREILFEIRDPALHVVDHDHDENDGEQRQEAEHKRKETCRQAALVRTRYDLAFFHPFSPLFWLFSNVC